MIDQTVAYFCGPALAGIKPSNIVTCHKKKYPNLHNEINRLNLQLNKRDIYFEILSECEKRVLLMVYRHKLLDRYLHQKEIKNLLLSFGYTNENNVTDYLNRLKGHLKRTEFPHEIGAFLGYPADDIYGFIYHKNKGCLLTGEWKVYHNVEKARILFLKYQTCRYALLKRLAQGKTLAEIFCAA